MQYRLAVVGSSSTVVLVYDVAINSTRNVLIVISCLQV